MTMTDITIRQTSWQKDEEDLRKIREKVFIEEQQVPLQLEWDGLDMGATHWLVDVDGKTVATARMLDNGHIGRMAVLADYRHKGIGSALLKSVIATGRQRGLAELILNAQTTAIPFYTKQGFHAEGDVFDDAGIPHRRMRLTLQSES